MSETTKAVQSAQKPKGITDQVLTKVQMFVQTREIQLPENYSPENALKSANLILMEQAVSGKPVLEYCTPASIANALFDMVIQGLSPAKKQCYFIPYGNKLTMSRSYMGSIAVAKRIGGVKSVNANVIYKDDVFEFGVDTESGIRKVFKHEQKLSNIDDSKIAGVYAVVITESGQNFTEIMTLPQIEKAWQQGATKGQSPAHKNFAGEMAKKTVINRALKLFINSADDSGLCHVDEDLDAPLMDAVHEEIADNSAKTELRIETTAEVVQPEVKPETESNDMFSTGEDN